jgi:hypothetical protein
LTAPGRVAAVIAAGALAVAAGGCGDGASRPAAARRELAAYVGRVEPIRTRVNDLLDRADPILAAYRRRELMAGTAGRRLEALERRFAAEARRIAAVPAVPARLRAAQRAYAHTYVLEDAYLSALVPALPDRDFGTLPATQSRQRAAIIAWRIGLEVSAARLGVRLPADVQKAGRGEIAPSPLGD